MRAPTLLLTLGLLACPPAKDDSAPHDDTSPPVETGETGETAPPDDTSETAPPDDTGPLDDQDADGWTPAEGDCDDRDPTRHPGATEWCNGVDDDCDGDVDEDECPAGCDLWVPYEQPTLQAAVDAVPDGATVCVEAGRYREGVVLDGRSLTLLGFYGAGVTLLDGSGTDRPLTILGAPGDQVVLQGFTLMEGVATQGGGLLVEGADVEAADLALVDNEAADGGGLALTGGASMVADTLSVRGNHASQAGGGIYMDLGSSLQAQTLRIHENDADAEGGGLYAAEDNVVELSDGTLQENQSGANNGGALYLADGSLDLVGLTIASNESACSGGGAWIGGATAASLTDVILDGNDAGAGCDGGGLFLGDTATLDLEGVVLLDNEGGERGAGLFVDVQTTAAGRDVLVQSNDGPTEGQGEGLYVAGMLSLEGATISHHNTAWGGGIYVAPNGTLTLISSAVVDNHTSAQGGGIYADHAVLVLDDVLIGGSTALTYGAAGAALFAEASHVTATNLLLLDNRSSSSGGAVEATHGSVLDFSQVTAVGNESTDGGGGVVHFEPYATAGASLSLTGCVFAGNSALSGGVLDAGAGLALTATWNDFWDNGPDDVAGVSDPVGSDGNQALDPALLDITSTRWEDWDLHLGASSPLIGAGDPSLVDPDGSTSDPGAYGGAAAGAWDLDQDGYPLWWQPGPYDSATYPAAGWDCDDMDEAVYPGAGC